MCVCLISLSGVFMCFFRQALCTDVTVGVCTLERASEFCSVALYVSVSVHLRSLTHTPSLRGPRWVRWVSTYGVHGLDHSRCRGDVGRLLLQAVGLLVDCLYLDVWFTEGDAPATWKRNATSGSTSRWMISFFLQSTTKQVFILLISVVVWAVWAIICLVLFIFCLLIMVH